MSQSIAKGTADATKQILEDHWATSVYEVTNIVTVVAVCLATAVAINIFSHLEPHWAGAEGTFTWIVIGAHNAPKDAGRGRWEGRGGACAGSRDGSWVSLTYAGQYRLRLRAGRNGSIGGGGGLLLTAAGGATLGLRLLPHFAKCYGVAALQLCRLPRFGTYRNLKIQMSPLILKRGPTKSHTAQQLDDDTTLPYLLRPVTTIPIDASQMHHGNQRRRCAPCRSAQWTCGLDPCKRQNKCFLTAVLVPNDKNPYPTKGSTVQPFVMEPLLDQTIAFGCDN